MGDFTKVDFLRRGDFLRQRDFSYHEKFFPTMGDFPYYGRFFLPWEIFSYHVRDFSYHGIFFLPWRFFLPWEIISTMGEILFIKGAKGHKGDFLLQGRLYSSKEILFIRDILTKGDFY